MPRPYLTKCSNSRPITYRHILVAVLTVLVVGYMEEHHKPQVGTAIRNVIALANFSFDMLATGISLTRSGLEMVLASNQSKPSDAAIVIRPNYANIYGGATILMKSVQCHGLSHILSDDNDRYMYTESTSHIEFVIGLKEQIAIESISVKSMEMYSSIVRGFRVEGSFTFPDANWTELGTFKAANNFKQQNFIVNRMVLRYVKFTVMSVYGGWAYFTLTQLKVFGEGIFAHAAKATEEIQAESQNISPAPPAIEYLTSKADSCPDDPLAHFSDNEELKRDNVIVSLHEKIRTLENNSKNLEATFQKLLSKYEKLSKKMERLLDDRQSEQLESEAKNITQTNKEARESYFIFEAVSVVVVVFGIAVCLCHFSAYVKDPDNQVASQSPRLKMTRRISRSKTYKLQRKTVEAQELPTNVTQ